jgi:hypothetical protein
VVFASINPQICVTYHSTQHHTGKAFNSAPFMLAAHAVAPIYQGANSSGSGQGLPNGGLPAGFYGSATVTSAGGDIVMVVNEAGNLTKNGTAQSGTYTAQTLSAGSNHPNNIGLPIVANGGNGYITGATILNTTDTPQSGTINYYKVDGTIIPTVANQSFSIAAHASLPIYQGAAGLPIGFYGGAVITSTSSNSNGLIVTTNAQNDNMFFTYTEPN